MMNRVIQPTDELIPVEGREDEKSVLTLLRRAADAARVLILEGAEPHQARVLVALRAGAGIPAGDHPALWFIRAKLNGAVDRAIYLAMLERESEA